MPVVLSCNRTRRSAPIIDDQRVDTAMQSELRHEMRDRERELADLGFSPVLRSLVPRCATGPAAVHAVGSMLFETTALMITPPGPQRVPCRDGNRRPVPSQERADSVDIVPSCSLNSRDRWRGLVEAMPASMSTDQSRAG